MTVARLARQQIEAPQRDPSYPHSLRPASLSRTQKVLGWHAGAGFRGGCFEGVLVARRFIVV
eukprot:2329883-Rhodomonas_salina.4